MNFKEQLKIDKYNLDKEWELQPQLYAKWAEAYADAAEVKDRAELRLKVVEAQLFEKIKNKWKEFGLEKAPSDTMAKQIVYLQPEYRDAYEALITAKKNLAVLDAAKRSMEQRKKALENITMLWITGYYAEPYVPKDAKEKMWDKNRQLVQEKLTASLRRRRTE